ncbi:MAG: YdeI/OmpD-associated family protein [Deinococcales bacterium]
MGGRTGDQEELTILALPSAAAWEAWLERRGDASAGVWLKIAKKGPQSDATVPDELAACLEAHPEARLLFEQLDSRNRYSILHRVRTAKRPETREKRARTYVDMLLRGETIHPPRSLGGGAGRELP